MSDFIPHNPDRSDNTLVIAGIAGAVFLLCICGGLVAFGMMTGLVSIAGLRTNSTPLTQMPFPYYGMETPTPPATPNFAAPPPDAEQLLQTLDEIEIPVRDRIDLAERFMGVTNAQAEQAGPYQVGATEQFWVDTGGDDVIRVQAELVYLTDVLYMWVETGLDYNLSAIQRSADRFTEQTYLTTQQYFGSEAIPGIDGDPRLHILHTGVMAAHLSGQFYSASAYPIDAVPNSNEKEIFFMSSFTEPGTDGYDSVLAHEFQHMIHWNIDPNENTWLNEGLSEVASTINGFGPSGFIHLYTSNPDLQLTNWQSGEAARPHYGASYLFMMYFMDRYGEDAFKALVARPENGLSSFDATLDELGEQITADDVFIDWTLATYLNDASIDARYAYPSLPTLPPPGLADTVFSYPHRMNAAQVSQYGVDYIRLDEPGDVTFRFDGARQVAILPTDTQESVPLVNRAEGMTWWSNRADNSDMTLTRTLDLSGVQTASLEFDVWYSIEKGYDYGYVAVSTDGEHWTALESSNTTTSNPHGNSYGPGYTGDSADRFTGGPEGWLHETIDLSAYTGQKISLRFEYITDDAVLLAGMALDNICVEAINWCDEAESGDEGWDAQGWVRHSNVLPQRWAVHVISYDANGDIQVTPLVLDEENSGEMILHVELDRPAVIVVSGLTRHTTQPATYNISLTPVP